MNSNSIFTRRHAGADAAASVSAPATTSAAAEDAFKNDPTATLEGVRGKDVTKAAKALLKDSVKRGGGSIQMRDVVKIYPGSTVHALDDFNLDIKPGEMVVLLGGSGCGKSTVLRTLDRMHEIIPGAHVEGEVLLEGKNLYDKDVDPVAVRRDVGMVFQRPNPFPTMSIRENVLAGVRLNNHHLAKSDADDLVEWALRGANLWEEVKDRLDNPGIGLSGGQQQRLCIARAVAVHPQVLLMDEPCSALDPISTLAIEDLIDELKSDYTIVIVTHNMQQAARIADYTAFFNLKAVGQPGHLEYFADTMTMFNNPQNEEAERYISGRFG